MGKAPRPAFLGARNPSNRPLSLSHDLQPNNSHNNLVSAMPGDKKTATPPPPPLPTTVQELAAMMTKLLGSMEARLTSLESRFAAAFPSFTAPSPMPPQQHCEGIFYGGVDGIQAAAAPLLPAARYWNPVVPAAIALPRSCRLQRAAGIQLSLH